MPKAKPTSTVVHRIELQTREREMLEQYLAAYTLRSAGSFAEGMGAREIAKMMDDPLKIIQVAYSIATIAELLGYETGWPTAGDFSQWYEEYQAKSRQMAIDREECGGSVGVLGQILDSLRVLFGADEDVLRSRWNCPEPGVEPPIGSESNPGAVPQEQEHRPGHDGNNPGGGPFGSPI